MVWKGFRVQERKVEVEVVPEMGRRARGSRKRTAVEEGDGGSGNGRKRRVRRDVEVEEGGDVRMLDVPPQISQQQQVNSATFSTLQIQESGKETHVQTIHLGAAVYDIAFLPSTILTSVSPKLSASAPADVSEDGNASIPLSTRLLRSHIVMAVICSDNSTRIISLPLHPTTPLETPEVLPLTTGHRSLPTAVSLTLVPSPPKPDQARTGLSSAPSYDLLVASVSPDLSGRLLLWRVALTSPGGKPRHPNQIHFVKPPAAPRAVPLSHPVLHMSFNPSSASSLSRHNLLLADTEGALRVYDTDKHQWLITLHMDYPAHAATRKKILGAAWCLDGQALVVLGGDGEWGVFELLGRGKFQSCGKVGETLDSSSSSSNARKRYGPGGTSIFSGSGGGSSTASSSTGGGTSVGNRSSIRSVFSASGVYPAGAAAAAGKPLISRGSLAVTVLPESRTDLFAGITPKATAASGDNEMLVLAYDNQILLVPSLQETYSAATAAAASTARGGGHREKTRAVELKDVVLGGEDIASLDIRWLMAKRPPASAPSRAPSSSSASRPTSRASTDFGASLFGVSRPNPKSPKGLSMGSLWGESTEDENEQEEEEDSFYINDHGDMVPAHARRRQPSEAERWMPRIQVVVGAGCRVSVVDVEEEVVSTRPAKAAGAGAGVGVGKGMGLGGGRLGLGFVPGLAGRVGGRGGTNGMGMGMGNGVGSGSGVSPLGGFGAVGPGNGAVAAVGTNASSLGLASASSSSFLSGGALGLGLGLGKRKAMF